MSDQHSCSICSSPALKRGWREIVIDFLKTNQWPLLAWLWGVAAVLGYWGWSRFHEGSPEPWYFWDKFYLTIQLFNINSGNVAGDKVYWQLQVARLLAPIASVSTAVAALALVFQEQVARIRIRFMSGHTVISGLGQRGRIVAEALLERGKSVVIIEKNPGNDGIPHIREKGGIVMIGNASDPAVLRKARVHVADTIISVCTDDGINAEVAVDARDLTADRTGKPLRCVVQVNDIDLCHLLVGQELALGKRGAFRLEFFNTYARGAVAILQEYPPFDEDETAPHLLVVGMGRLGQSIVVHAARAWRTRSRSQLKPLRVTLIDNRPEDKLSAMLMRTPMLESICDLHPLLIDVRSAEFHRAGFLFDGQGKLAVTRVYVCLDDDARALSAGLALLKALRKHDVPIVVRLARDDGLAQLIKRADGATDGFGNLQAFGFVERTCDPDLILGGPNEVLARALHTEYLDSRLTLGVGPDKDCAAVPWECVPENLKDSYRNSADHICLSLLAAGCTIEPLSCLDADRFVFTAEEEEQMASRLYELYVEDWGTSHTQCSPIFQLLETALTHPPVQWNQLPVEYRETYKDMVRSLPTFLAKSDFQVFAPR